MPRKNTNFINYIPAVILAFIVIMYSIFNFRVFIAGPQIEIISPVNGSGQDKNIAEITGIAKNINHIELNAKPIYVNEEGQFNEKLLLQPGYNVITLIAKDKFNREITEKLEINYSGNLVAITDNLGQADTDSDENSDKETLDEEDTELNKEILEESAG